MLLDGSNQQHYSDQADNVARFERNQQLHLRLMERQIVLEERQHQLKQRQIMLEERQYRLKQRQIELEERQYRLRRWKIELES